MKVDEMFPRKYASGEDLKGRAVRLCIERVSAEEVFTHGKAEKKYVVYFSGAQRGVMLSRTLAQQIAEASGVDDTRKWSGCWVELYPVAMTVAGVERVAIRARKPAALPQAEQVGNTPPPLADDDDDEPDGQEELEL